MPKILLETREYKEIDIAYPFFAHLEEDDYEVFVMIDYEFFRSIKMTKFTGRVEFVKHRSSNSLDAIWFENKCEKELWEQAQRQLRYILSKF